MLRNTPLNEHISQFVYSIADEHLNYLHSGVIMNNYCRTYFVVMFSFLYVGLELLGEVIYLTLLYVLPTLAVLVDVKCYLTVVLICI